MCCWLSDCCGYSTPYALVAATYSRQKRGEMERTIKCTGVASQTKAKRMGALVVAYGHIVACPSTGRGPRAAARILLYALRSWRVGALCEQDAPRSHRELRRRGCVVPAFSRAGSSRSSTRPSPQRGRCTCATRIPVEPSRRLSGSRGIETLVWGIGSFYVA